MRNSVLLLLFVVNSLLANTSKEILGTWVLGEGDIDTKFYTKELKITSDKKFILYGDTLGKYSLISETTIEIRGKEFNNSIDFSLSDNVLTLINRKGKRTKYVRKEIAYPSTRSLKTKGFHGKWYALTDFNSEIDTINFKPDRSITSKKYLKSLTKEKLLKASYRIINEKILEFKLGNTVYLSNFRFHNQYLELNSPFFDELQAFIKVVDGTRPSDKKLAKPLVDRWVTNDGTFELSLNGKMKYDNNIVGDYSVISDSMIIFIQGNQEGVSKYIVTPEYLILQENEILYNGSLSIAFRESKLLSEKELLENYNGAWQVVRKEGYKLVHKPEQRNKLIKKDTVYTYSDGYKLNVSHFFINNNRIHEVFHGDTTKVSAIKKGDTLFLSNQEVLVRCSENFLKETSEFTYDESFSALEIHKVIDVKETDKWLSPLIQKLNIHVEKKGNYRYINDIDSKKLLSFLDTDSGHTFYYGYKLLKSREKESPFSSPLHQIILVDTAIALSGKNIKKCIVSSDMINIKGFNAVKFILDSYGSNLFEKLTEESIGTSIAICVNGALVMCIEIKEKISSGSFMVSFKSIKKTNWRYSFEELKTWEQETDY